MRRSMRRALVLCFATALLLAACGDDDGGGSADDTATTAASEDTASDDTEATEDTEATDDTEAGEDGGDLVDAITDAMVEDAASDPTNPFGETEARCFAEGIVDVIGVEELVALGLSADDIRAGAEPGDVTFSEEQANGIADVTFGCIDLGAAIASTFPVEISDESQTCLGDRLEASDAMRAILVAEFLGQDAGSFEDADPATQVEFTDIITRCLTAEELVELGQAPG